MPAEAFMSIGTDVVDELEHLCVEVKKRFPRAVFFAGQLVFQRDTWYQRLLHNETPYSLQRRLQWDGLPMVILRVQVKKTSMPRDHSQPIPVSSSAPVEVR